MKEANKARAEKVLNVLMRYDEGVMSRRDWLEMQFNKGSSVRESTKNRIDFDRRKFNRMTSYAEQEVYEKKCSEKVICYKLDLIDESFYYITKAEFEYFNSLKIGKKKN